MNNGFKDVAVTLLNELTHGVKVCREVNRCRENPFIVFAFTFTIKLFPPFGYIVKRRLIVHENFSNFTFAIQSVTNCSILIAGIFGQVRIAVFLGSVSRTLHHFFNIDT
ncbi:hypothetical protein D3C71_1260700 [compost metagenome]